MEEERPIETIEYRGYSVPVYIDDYSQSYWCVIDNEEIGLGTYNFRYEDDIRYLVDSKLDTIDLPDKISGARLSWFFNGINGDRDIQLSYRTRVVKIWLVEDESAVDLNKIKTEAVSIIEKITRVKKL